jgi:hypothetical protein
METFTPPAKARWVRPALRSWMARWMALREEEHMVSRVRLGPWIFRK